MMPAGVLHFHPGRPLPTIESSRPLGLSRALCGQPAARAAQVLPALYAMCAGAHRLAATLATDAALGLRAQARAEELAALRQQTLLEHLRRMWLDWPRWLQGASASEASLSTLAQLLSAIQAPDADSAAAVARVVFGGTPADMQAWQRACQAGEDAALDAWAHGAGTLPALALQAVWQPAQRLAQDALPAVPIAWPAASLARLWLALWPGEESPIDFVAAPRWQGHPAETGPWTRALERPPRHALDRLLGHLAETAHLALQAPGPSPLLPAGAWSPEPGQALGWCQMARGLLVHAVRLEGVGDAARIADYQVLAPTEWNFHPRGSAARALSALDDRMNPRTACGLIGAAFDPCVEFDIRNPAKDPQHA